MWSSDQVTRSRSVACTPSHLCSATMLLKPLSRNDPVAGNVAHRAFVDGDRLPTCDRRPTPCSIPLTLTVQCFDGVRSSRIGIKFVVQYPEPPESLREAC